MTRRVISYGLEGPACDVTATDLSFGPFTVRATIHQRQRSVEGFPALVKLGSLSLQVPGRHNLLNALAAVAVGLELGLSFERIAAGLAEFRGVERRFEVHGEPNNVLIVDDYSHHPTEIAAALDAARKLNRRLVVAFQPHRYTRTAALLDSFGPALAAANHIVLTDIYPAGEDPIPGITIERLAEAIRNGTSARVEVVPVLDDVVPALVREARPGDAVITLGAGSIGTLPGRLVEAFAEQATGSHATRSSG
jgi:UDP-N-acetylmuramate--alanine ligase